MTEENREFDEFLKIAKKGTLSAEDEKSLQSALKSHPEWLKDQSKIDRLFPDPVLKGGTDGKPVEMTKTEACGFERTDCIRNVIAVAANLNKEKGADGKPVLSDEAFNDFMQSNDSVTGRNFATVVARNLKANEFKTNRSNNDDLKSILHDNRESLLKTLSLIKENAPDLMQTKDGNAVQASAYLADNSLKVTDLPERQAGQTLKIGGAAKDLNVNTQPQDINVNPEDEEKVADIQQGQEESSKHQSLSFGKVKEQDIIEYMFNDWFLAALNWSMEKIYNLADNAVDRLCTSYQPAPKTPKVTARQQNNGNGSNGNGSNGSSQAGSDKQTPDASKMFKNINGVVNDLTFDNEDIKKRYELIIEDIKNNAHKPDPKDWDTKVLNPKKHGEFMKACNKLYTEDPKAFEERLKNKEKMIGAVAPEFAKKVKMAATIATIAHASDPKNLGKPIDDEAKMVIKGRMELILKDMEKARTIIEQKFIDEFRTKNKLGPDAVIKDDDMREIRKKTDNEYSLQIDDLATKTLATRDDLAKYYDATDKKEPSKTLEISREAMMGAINELGNVPKDKDKDKEKDNGKGKEEPRNLRDEAEKNNKEEAFERQIDAQQKRSQNAHQNDRDRSDRRKADFEKGKNPSTTKKAYVAPSFTIKKAGRDL